MAVVQLSLGRPGQVLDMSGTGAGSHQAPSAQHVLARLAQELALTEIPPGGGLGLVLKIFQHHENISNSQVREQSLRAS